MFNIRKYSYVILWAALILAVAVVWLFGGQDTADYVRDSTALSQGETKAQPAEQPRQSLPSSGESSGQRPPAAEAETPDTEAYDTAGQALKTENRDMGREAEKEAERELIGIWIPYMSLVTAEKTPEAFQSHFEEMVATCKEMGINTLFVHVRPFCDALYASEHYPFSHILTGTQGEDPGFDPLAFMVDCAHANDMQLHAWINPLRVKSSETPESLSDNNPYSILNEEYPEYFMTDSSGIYLNPAYQYIRSLIAEGAREIVRNYDVDGIHFDDYFYPSDAADLDTLSYGRYVSEVTEPMSLLDYRAANISAMVSEVYAAVKAENPDVLFGISPAGNLDNNRKIGADIQEWCSIAGYIDYICPQLYYSYDNPALGYHDALETWLALDRHAELKLYIGLALYKAGSDADEGSWQNSDTIIQQQIEEARAAKCDGVALYAYDHLKAPQSEREAANAAAVLGSS